MAETKRMTAEQVVGYLLEEEGVDFLRESLTWVVQQLMEAEVSGLIGAERGERSEERLTHRNGYRPRRWDTRAGELELAIPKIRRGSYFPSFLEPRKRSEQALVAVIQEAYVAGVSTRKVDQVVETLGLRLSKSEVSRICSGLDEHVEAFRSRPLEGSYPYLFLDAKVEKVRDGGRVVRKCDTCGLCERVRSPVWSRKSTPAVSRCARVRDGRRRARGESAEAVAAHREATAELGREAVDRALVAILDREFDGPLERLASRNGTPASR